MKQYLVGGAVRDRLMGLPVKDHDWVVVGADPQAMLRAGYTPVGRDFPVFLHPRTHEEYALARTERKTAPGYHGFDFQASPEVTLEDDLARRDLTINAMAQDDDGLVIDPYGGQQDLAAKVLRHVSPAFAEDPVRILRLARFAARFADFSVAPETFALMRQMVADGEVDALVAERVWQEFSRGLMEARPSRMLQVLRDCGALARLCPEVDALFGVPQPEAHHPEIDTGIHLLMVLDQCAAQGAPLPVRFASLCHDLGKALTPADLLPRHIGHEGRGVPLVKRLSERWRVPTDCREVAEMVTREHTHVHQSESFGPEARLRLLERCDAWRRPERFEQLLWACECDARGRLGLEHRPYPQRERLLRDLRAVQAIDLGAVSAAALAEGKSGPAIGRAVQAARLSALLDLQGM
ncbi:multifunctional CCA addition/repair protein [Roseateles oligotrophus]|uniref:Multifunctional CCA protein n=1 Tax=Roseateles oligotrophus TaxID=1769250 RepID=A0ABT2YHL4_9BURK|nr:multifunctional CCA addition/repair protein [Roseateles oligotrophus]MCV2369546.1 multifunctional CCA addition/repair protein [Roseateles oligotrophus]